MEKEKKQQSILTGVLGCSVILLLLLTIGISDSLWKKRVNQKTADIPQYDRHYALVTDSFGDILWNTVYEEARAYGEQAGVYLEWMGKDLDVDYKKAELMRLAIDASVDGILLEGDSSEELKELIAEAERNGILVVTVFSDCHDSARIGFVGVSSYDLGREYAREIIRVATKETREVLVLMDTAIADSGQSVVFNGMKETLSNEGNHLTLELQTLAVSEDTTFGGEEEIRRLLSQSVQGQVRPPDMIICLSEKNTMRTYQAIVDYNLVGKTALLGYYVTDEILDGIGRKVIQATIAVDATKMGVEAIRALEEYVNTGHVNNFINIDVDVVTINNMKEYLQDGQKEE